MRRHGVMHGHQLACGWRKQLAKIEKPERLQLVMLKAKAGYRSRNSAESWRWRGAMRGGAAGGGNGIVAYQQLASQLSLQLPSSGGSHRRWRRLESKQSGAGASALAAQPRRKRQLSMAMAASIPANESGSTWYRNGVSASAIMAALILASAA